MQEVEKLKKKRRVFRRNATKLIDKIYERVSGDAVSDTQELKIYVAELKDTREELKILDNEILGFLLEDDDEDTCDQDVQDASGFKEKITE